MVAGGFISKKNDLPPVNYVEIRSSKITAILQ